MSINIIILVILYTDYIQSNNSETFIRKQLSHNETRVVKRHPVKVTISVFHQENQI